MNLLIKLSAFLTIFFLSSPLFAQDAIAQLNSTATTILGHFQSPFVKAILAIFLCGSAIAYAFNKDNEKIKRGAIAVGIAAIIVMGASGIVGLVWTAS